MIPRRESTHTYQATWMGDKAEDLQLIAPPRAKKPAAKRTEETWEPVGEISLRSQWGTPLANAVTAWAGTSILLHVIQVGYLHTPRPGLSSFCVGGIAAAIIWIDDRDFFREALYRTKNLAEEILSRDLDGDGTIGRRPDVIDPFPVFANQQPPATVDVPPSPTYQADKLIRLRPAARTITCARLCDYLRWAHANTTDNRDGWSRESAKEFGIGPREWEDIQNFVKRWDRPEIDTHLWKTTDPPALERFIASIQGA